MTKEEGWLNLCVIVKTCSDICFTIGQNYLPEVGMLLPPGRRANQSDGHRHLQMDQRNLPQPTVYHRKIDQLRPPNHMGFAERYRPGNRRSENEGWTSLPHCLGRGRFYSKERNETQRKDTALPRYPFPYRANKIHLHRTRYLMLATVQPPINQTVCHAQFTGDFR